MEMSPVKELTQKLIQNIDSHNLIRTQRIIVGLSGGPDSVCLLHVLWSLSEKYGYMLYPAHLNHMLRGEEADRDEEYCISLCKSLNLPLKIWKKDIKQISIERKKSTEEVAREERYFLFREYAKSIGDADIAVAHNMNDQAETLFMRIIRGTGLDGLKGMEFYSEGIIRPLLSVPRALIEEYNSSNSLNPITDSSNLETDYTRNKIRLQLLPYIKEVSNIDPIPALYRLSQTCNEDSKLLSKIIEREYENCFIGKENNIIKLSIDKLKKIPIEAIGRVIRHALADFTDNLKGIENVHIEQVKALLLSGKTGSIIQLPQNIRFYRDYTYIKLYKDEKKEKEPKEEIYIEIDNQGEYLLTNNKKLKIKYISIEEYKKEVSKTPQNSLIQYFDFEATKEIVLRNKRTGDFFHPFGAKGSKKLKEFLIDNKIPKEIRDELILLAKGKEIIWIVGIRTSDKFKVNAKTNNVIKAEIINI